MTERDEKIIDLYLNHPEIKTADIAKQFGVSTGTVSRIARINNLPRRTGNKVREFSKEQREEITQKYLNSTPLLTLQKEYKMSYDQVKGILVDANVWGQISSAKRINPNLIENYFSNIDTPEKAYWIGWIISDGAITNNPEKTKYQLELTIKKEDEKILYLLQDDLKVEDKVYDSGELYKRFSLGCKNIINDLDKLGITQNKSFTVKVPYDKINPELYSHLIRGLFDGDGGFTVYTRATGQKCQELSFCGNEEVVTWIANTLFKAIPDLTHNSITKESSIKRIRWSSKKDIKLITGYMYEDKGNHYLDRKFNLINANTEVTE